MFGIDPTPYDLRFSMFRIPVRVHPGFWIISAVMGWEDGRLDLVLIWIACVFVSILIHELGHALTAEAFGWPSEIVLYHFGGLAMFQPYHRNTPGRRILVSFMGPGAGFLFFGLIVLLELGLAIGRVRVNEQILVALFYLQWINLWWGLVNLLPILPLDGGRICETVTHMVRRLRDPMALTLKISAVVAGGTALYFLVSRDGQDWFLPLFFGFLCFNSVQALQAHQRGYW